MSEPRDPQRRALLVGALATAGLAATRRDAQAARPTADDALSEDADIAADVVGDALNAWLSQASYTGGEIHGVMLRGGQLDSDVDVATLIEDGLVDEGFDAAIAARMAAVFADAWADWADGWTLPTTRAFPEFAAVSTPEAPVTEAQAIALQPGASAGFRKLRPAALERSLKGELEDDIVKGTPIKGSHGMSDFVHTFAWRVGQRVVDWSAEAMVEGIFGSGPVPTFAPPYVPVGPVVAGDNLPGPVHITAL